MAAYDEERLGELLSVLPPAPDEWVRTAADLPFARLGLAAIIERAEADEEFRRRVLADPTAVLEEAEVVAHLDLAELLRRRLSR
jgi:hypothetical protein